MARTYRNKAYSRDIKTHHYEKTKRTMQRATPEDSPARGWKGHRPAYQSRLESAVLWKDDDNITQYELRKGTMEPNITTVPERHQVWYIKYIDPFKSGNPNITEPGKIHRWHVKERDEKYTTYRGTKSQPPSELISRKRIERR